MICIPHKHYLRAWSIWGGRGAWGTYLEEGKCVGDLGGKTWSKEATLKG